MFKLLSLFFVFLFFSLNYYFIVISKGRYHVGKITPFSINEAQAHMHRGSDSVRIGPLSLKGDPGRTAAWESTDVCSLTAADMWLQTVSERVNGSVKLSLKAQPLALDIVSEEELKYV